MPFDSSASLPAVPAVPAVPTASAAPVVLPSPAAVLFDLDGTLVDSERDAADALSEVLRRHGRPLTPDERLFMIGHGWADIHACLAERGALPLSLDEMEEEVYQVRVSRARQGVRVLPGAVPLVRRAAAAVPCALVTGSSRKEAELMLDALDLRGVFRALLCAGDYPHGKPAPDPYLLAAAAAGAAPARCLALEDSQAGIASARAAGTFCIAVRAGNFAGQDQSGAHLVVDSLLEVDGLLKWG